MRDTRRKENPTDESPLSTRTIGEQEEGDINLRWARVAFILSVLTFLTGPLFCILVPPDLVSFDTGVLELFIAYIFLFSFFVVTPFLALAVLHIVFYRCRACPALQAAHVFKQLSFLVLGFGFFSCMMPLLHPGGPHPRSCARFLKMCGYSCARFAEEKGNGYYPELSPEPGRLRCALEGNRGVSSLIDDYLVEPIFFTCPMDDAYEAGLVPDWAAVQAGELDQVINDRWYMYLGYAVRNDREVAAFAKAYRERLAEGKRFDEDLKVAPGEGTSGTDTIYQLHVGVDSFWWWHNDEARDEKPVIPLLIERIPNNHKPKGGHVLYMDGHVEYLAYPGKWPMTETTMTTLQELADIDENRREYTVSEKFYFKLRSFARKGMNIFARDRE